MQTNKLITYSSQIQNIFLNCVVQCYSVDITTTRRKLYSFVGLSLLKLCLRKQAIDFGVIIYQTAHWCGNEFMFYIIVLGYNLVQGL